MQAGFKGVIDCIKAFSETDFTEDLKKFDVPTLILHGDDDQIVPIGASAMLSSKLVKGATLKVYPGAPHGMCSTLKDQVNEGSACFLQGMIHHNRNSERHVGLWSKSVQKQLSRHAKRQEKRNENKYQRR